MKTGQKILAVVALVGAGVIVVEITNKKGGGSCSGGVCCPPPSIGSGSKPVAVKETKAVAVQGLPRLVDLGSSQCIPCKMMKPALDDLKANYADRFDTVFIDVLQDPQAGQEYGISVIPTQIFFDADGNELFRHEGFLSREDILTKWKELGFDF